MSRENIAPLEEMHLAVRKRDVVAMRRLFTQHESLRAMVNAPILPFDSPPLVALAGDGDVGLVDVLLEFGADPNRRSNWWAGGFHPLHSATGAVADRLIAAGAVPDACAAAHLDRPDLLTRILDADSARVHERGGDGQTPLHFARSRGVVDLLLARGADINARDVDHRSTPAQWMLDGTRGSGRYALASYLVERGAECDIFLAAALGLTERVRAMVQADERLIEARTSHGEYAEKPPSSFHIYTWTIGANLSPIEVAAKFGQRDTMEVLRALTTPRQRFLIACKLADAEDAWAVLEEHPDIVSRLDPADHRALPDAAWAGNAEAVALMLEVGFDPFAQGQDGGTALHCAAWEGSVACVDVILRHPVGRDLIPRKDPTHHSTPLDWCCHGSRNCGDGAADYPEVARMLMAAGAAPGRNFDDATAEVRAVIEASLRLR
jgi:ankyrin repeat protein